MTCTMTEVMQQFKHEWPAQREPDAIVVACRRVGHQWRDRYLNPVVTMNCFFVQILHGNTACTHLRPFTKCAISASAYCQARMQLPLAIFQPLLRRTCGRWQDEQRDEGRWLGHRLLVGDGSSCSLPDTPALQAHFGQPGAHLPGCGVSVAHLTALFHATSGRMLEVLAAPLRTNDLPQVVSVPPEWHPTAGLVGDRALCAYAHLALLSPRGVHAVLRMHQQQMVDFTPGRRHVVPGHEAVGHKGKPRSRWTARLGEQDQLVAWLKPPTCPRWMSKEPVDELPDRLRLRALRYRTQRPGFRVQTIPLVTPLGEPQTSSLAALAALYLARWRAATTDAHLKTSMGLDVLKGQTVDGVLKALIVFALIYHLVRLVMWEAAQRQQVDVERISFMDALRGLASADDGEPFASLVVNPYRPRRYEPRVLKRRPKPYSLMRKPRQVLRNQLLSKSLGLT